MTLWLVRAGASGEDEPTAIARSVAIIGFQDVPDLMGAQTREAVKAEVDVGYPDDSEKARINYAGQLWAFVSRIQVGDLVVLPLKRQAAIAIGEVTGPYQYRRDLGPGPRHTRPVKWLRTDIPRSSVDQDLLYSLGAFMTVCQIQRNNAEERFKAILKGKRIAPPPLVPEDQDADTATPVDLEGNARDQIRGEIGRRFRGHDLERLVSAILKATGYRTLEAPIGADGGVDILAGRGPMGFDAPRLCVQVKSSDQPLDVKVLRELQGVMRNYGAHQGLLVSWGSFKTTTLNEARTLFFEIRLWDSDDIIEALLECYSDLPPDIQAELPLKQVWMLVPEDGQG